MLQYKSLSLKYIIIIQEGLNRSDKTPLTLVLSGFVRAKGNSDAALNRFLKQQGLLSFE